MKINCQFLGCKGIIDLDDEFKYFQEIIGPDNNKKIKNVPWCTHAIICPKCGNSVGSIDLGPDVWLLLGSDNASIHNPCDKKKGVIIKNYNKHKRFGRKKLLNPYLKDWAKIGKKQK